MRVNVYAEEMTDRIEIIGKEIDGHTFTGLRFYLELPATLPDGTNYAAPFIHRPGDDDSAAVTFWGKRDLRDVLHKALAMLDVHYGSVLMTHASLTADIVRQMLEVTRDCTCPGFEGEDPTCPEHGTRGRQAYLTGYKDALRAAVQECTAHANELTRTDARAAIIADTCAKRIERLEAK